MLYGKVKINQEKSEKDFTQKDLAEYLNIAKLNIAEKKMAK